MVKCDQKRNANLDNNFLHFFVHSSSGKCNSIIQSVKISHVSSSYCIKKWKALLQALVFYETLTCLPKNIIYSNLKFSKQKAIWNL